MCSGFLFLLHCLLHLARGRAHFVPTTAKTPEDIKRSVAEFDPQPYHLDEAAAGAFVALLLLAGTRRWLCTWQRDHTLAPTCLRVRRHGRSPPPSSSPLCQTCRAAKPGKKQSGNSLGRAVSS